MLVGDYEVDPDCMKFIIRRQKKEDIGTVYLVFAPPIPRKPTMIDYLYFKCREVVDNLANKKCIAGVQSHSDKITNNNRPYFQERINIPPFKLKDK